MPPATAEPRGGSSSEPGRDHDLDRREAAAVQRDARRHDRAQHVDHGGAHDGRRRIQIARRGRARAGEVDLHARGERVASSRAGGARSRGDADRCPVVERVGEARARPAASFASSRATIRAAARLQLAHAAWTTVRPSSLHELREPRRASAIRRDHRLEIGDVVVGPPRRIGAGSEQRTQSRLVEAAGAHEREGFDQDALLARAASNGRASSPAPRRRDRRGGHDSPRRSRARDSPDQKHGADDGDVGQMRAAFEGIVGHDRVAVGEGREAQRALRPPYLPSRRDAPGYAVRWRRGPHPDRRPRRSSRDAP